MASKYKPKPRPKKTPDSPDQAEARFPIAIRFPLKDEALDRRDVAKAIVLLRHLSDELTAIENHPTHNATERAKVMRKTILRYGLAGSRLSQMMRDGGVWLTLVTRGVDAEEALETIATERGAKIGAVRRNVQRYFERVNREPPVPIPQGRDRYQPQGGDKK